VEVFSNVKNALSRRQGHSVLSFSFWNNTLINNNTLFSIDKSGHSDNYWPRQVAVSDGAQW